MIKLKELIPISEGLKYHIDNKIPLMENTYIVIHLISFWNCL
jgi:hypothetical protein